MNKDKDIAKVNEAFGSERYAAPEGLWDQIHEQLDRDDAAVYGEVKDAYETSYTAPDGLWGGIERGLTIESTWSKIRSYLIWRELVNRAAQFMSVLLLLAISIRLSVTDHVLLPGNTSTAESTTITDTTEEIATSEQGQYPNQRVIQIKEGAGLNSPAHPGLLTNTDNKVEEHIENRASSEMVPTPLMEESEAPVLLESIPINGFPHNVGSWPSSGLMSALNLPQDLNGASRPRYAVGALMLLNNPGLQNNTSEEASRAASNTESEVSINYSFGLVGHYMSPRGDLVEARYIRNKVMNQAYNRFEAGDYVAQDLVMLYDHIDLNYQRAVLFNGPRPSLFIGAGVYGAYLNAATLIKEESLEDRTKVYAAWDAGVGIGAKKQWTSGPLLIDLDLSTAWGLVNIHQGNDVLPAQFDLTYTRNSSLTLSVKYAF